MKKAQISIEFIIVFSFILVVFLFLFALIAQQRAVTANSQTFSQLQLIAQGIALQLGRAAQAGNGYSASLPISTSLGVTQYNLSITKSGLVIVTSLVSNQALRATAYSNVQGVLSSPQFLSPLSTAVYNLPISNGTVYVQNSYGNICVDYQCPLQSNQVSSVSLSDQIAHPAYFNGQSSNILVQNTNALNPPSGITISVWFDAKSLSGTAYLLAKWETSVYSTYYVKLFSGNSIEVFFNNGATSYDTGTIGPIYAGTWYNLIFTVNDISKSGTMYLNGVQEASLSGIAAAESPDTNPLVIGSGTGSLGASGDFYSGSVANLQIYNQNLSPSQVNQLYVSGISGQPVLSTNLVGWWPLDGNANDYGGNGNSGVVTGPLLYLAVSQIYAKATNQAGQAINGALVGFETTLGNFTNGFGAPAQSVGVYTSNGFATTFLSQQGNNGQALVKAVAYNGNQSVGTLMKAWYPLDLGQGSNALDLSGNGNSGSFSGQPSWTTPNYVANFDGVTGYAAAPTNVLLNGATAITVSLWFNAGSLKRYVPSTGSHGLVDEEGTFGLKLNPLSSPLSLALCLQGVAWCATSAKYNYSSDRWYNVVATWSSGNAVSYYINGAIVNQSPSYSGTITASASSPLMIGEANSAAPLAHLFNGSISNVEIYNTALSPQQVEQIYNSGLSGFPINGVGLQAWYPLDGNTNDYSGNGNNASIYGGVSFEPTLGTVPAQAAIANTSRVLTASFNGVSSFMTVGNIVKINSLSNWSVSFWMNSTNAGAYHNPLDANFNPASNNAGPRFEQGGSPGANSLNLVVGSSASSYNVITYSNVIIPNAWYHVVAAKSGNTIIGYLNGVMVFDKQNSLWPTGFANLTIGRGFSNSANRWYAGNLSNVEIYNQTLSSQQVLQLYQEGIGGSPLSGTKVAGWWPLNGKTNDYGLNGYNATYSANIVYQNKPAYVPSLTSSQNLSGVGFNGQSYILLPSTAAVLGSADRSVSLWIRTAPTWGSAGSVLFSWGQETSGNWFGLSYPGSTNKIDFADWGVADHLSAPLQTNKWYNVVATLGSGGTVLNLYINGAKDPNFPITSAAFNTLPGSVFISGRNDLCVCANLPAGSQVQDVQIYSNTLTAGQVLQLYNGGIPPSASATIPLSWYP